MARGLPEIKALQWKFGRVLRARREKLGLSQEELADRCGLHRTYISLLERGMKSPSLGVILLLAQALHSRPHQLIKESEEYTGRY